MKKQFLNEVQKLLKDEFSQQIVSEGCYQLLKKTLVLHSQTLSMICKNNGDINNITTNFLKKRKNIISSILQIKLSEKEKKFVSNFFLSNDKIFKKYFESIFSNKNSQVNIAYKWQKVITHYNEAHQKY